MTFGRRFAATALAATAMLVASVARAQLQIDVTPIFGDACVPRAGTTEIVVTLTNPSATLREGTARIERVTASFQPGVRTVVSVPFAVGPRTRIALRVPTPSGGIGAGDAMLTVRDARGATVQQRPLRYENPVDAILLDASPQGRLAYALRAANNPDPSALPSLSASPLTGLATGFSPCPANRVPQTGEIVLPQSQTGYGGVSLVLVDAGTIIDLPVLERIALADWVLTGGTLVVIPRRADELRHPTFAALLGTGITGVTPTMIDTAGGEWIAGIPGSPITAFPAAATLAHIESFQGGNLHDRSLSALFPLGAPNLLGASAEYGFGHVHVLSFDPTMPPALEDPWAVGVVASLTQQSANGHNGRVVDPEAADTGVSVAMRRALDPNEDFRPGLGFAVVALVLYSVLAGPVSFRLAARRRKPLRALALLPLWSAVLFAAIVGLGSVSRGFQGRARRFTLAEASAGVSRAAVRRFHGYFAGESGGVSLSANGSGRRLFVDPSAGTGYVTLALERGRSVLRGLALTPWTLLVVREEAMEPLPGAITLQPDVMGRIRMVNHSRQRLRSALLIAPNATDAWAFRDIGPEQTRIATSGAIVPPSLLGALNTSSWYSAIGVGSGHPGAQAAAVFGGDATETENWDAAVSTWPNLGSGASIGPVLVAEIDTRGTVPTDGNLLVDRDVTFLRVVGWGGAP